MDSDELRDFLEEEGVPSIVAQALHDQNMNGKMFVRIAGSTDKFKELATMAKLEDELTPAVILDLVGIRESVERRNAQAAQGTTGGGARLKRPGAMAPLTDNSESTGQLLRCLVSFFVLPTRSSTHTVRFVSLYLQYLYTAYVYEVRSFYRTVLPATYTFSFCFFSMPSERWTHYQAVGKALS